MDDEVPYVGRDPLSLHADGLSACSPTISTIL